MSLHGVDICFDVLGAQQLAWERGVPRYIAAHGRALLDVVPEGSLSFRADPDMPLMPPAQEFVATGRLQRTRDEPVGLTGDRRVLHVTSPFDMDQSIDVLWPRWARQKPWTTVATVWDLIPMRLSHYFELGIMNRAVYAERTQMLKAFDHLVAISQHTADDLQELLGVPEHRITVIDAGVDRERFAPPREDDAGESRLHRALPALRDRYLFYVGGDEPRKNMAGLVEAFARTTFARTGGQLVMTCALGDGRREWYEGLAADLGLPPGSVLMTGHIRDDVLAWLYRSCTLFVFPSLYEGSGLPLMEAMATGAPVIAASTSTGPEVLGTRDGTFDPRDPDDMARTIDAATEDPERLELLRRRSTERVGRYTWQHVAEQTAIGYERALEGAGPPTRRPRRSPGRLAVITPWPPQRSGIADYAQRLVAALRGRVDRPIDVVVSDSTAQDLGPQAGVLSDGAFRARVLLGERYDGALLQLGNGGFHSFMLPLLPWLRGHRIPATAMIHDAALSGMYTDAVRLDQDRVGDLAARAVGDYPFLGGKPPHELLFFLEHQAVTHGAFMTRDIQRQVERIVVHSKLARNLLLADRGPGDEPGIEVLPLAAPDPRSDAVERDPRLIVSTGYVAEVKGVSALVRALAELRRDAPDTHLVFAGAQNLPHERRDLSRLLQELGLEDAVTITGFLPAAERARYLARAGVVVQLRRHSHGEASAAVLDGLAAGAPTIVSDLGWMADLPDSAVLKVHPEVSPHDLSAALGSVLRDPGRAASLSKGALAHVRATSFDAVAAQVAATLGMAG